MHRPDAFRFEVWFQCYAATEAWNRAHDHLMTIPPPDLPSRMSAAALAVQDIQAFLAAAGVLSDLFFPGKRGDQGRGEGLRRMFRVADDSPFRQRKIRNSFLHVDERLDKWLRDYSGELDGPYAIRPWEGNPPPPEKSTHLRVVDNKNWRLLVLGEELDLFPLFREIDRIGHMITVNITAAGEPRLGSTPEPDPS